MERDETKKNLTAIKSHHFQLRSHMYTRNKKNKKVNMKNEKNIKNNALTI